MLSVLSVGLESGAAVLLEAGLDDVTNVLAVGCDEAGYDGVTELDTYAEVVATVAEDEAAVVAAEVAVVAVVTAAVVPVLEPESDPLVAIALLPPIG